MSILKNLFWSVIRLLIRLKFNDIKHLSTQNLVRWLSQSDREQPLLLDARTLQEYSVSHLPNAKLMPQNMRDLINWQEVDFSTNIVVYCSIGYRSSLISRQLNALGYQNIFNFNGSIFEWFDRGLSVYRGNKLVNIVHPYNRFWQYLLKSACDRTLRHQ
ncbi:MAG: rhodanese-like domain-containing protein [Prochloraceae cyanobacterium]|nr:rhodanese-like domain-containing protein [Prochloraceae cyanobacterium]